MKARCALIRTCLLAGMLLHAFTSSAQTITKIASGSEAGHSFFLKNDGSLWGMGDDTYGQLGDGTNGIFGDTFVATNRPEQIVTSNVMAITAGYQHNLFLKKDGSLWAFGFDQVGQLGDAVVYTNISIQHGTNKPEQIVASNVVAIAAGQFHSLFLKQDGSLWAMGANYYGQLGDGISYTSSGFQNSTNRPEQIVASNVTAIAAGGMHSLFLKKDGSLWAMGGNFVKENAVQVGGGQLGDGTYNNTNRPEMVVASNVVAIAAGDSHSLFLKMMAACGPWETTTRAN